MSYGFPKARSPTYAKGMGYKLIIIGSHDELDLKRYTDFNHMKICHFSDLKISNLHNPSQFAEAQIFLGASDDLRSGTYTGLVSPRFHARYPEWPDLHKIDSVLGVENETIKSNQILAPQAFSCKKKNLKYWIALQDLAHPGMGIILRKLLDDLPITDPNYKGNLIMGNTFIARRFSGNQLINNWENLVSKIDLNDKNSFGYTYKCLKCGISTEEGIGRWRANRQPAYLMERITALASFTIKNLQVCKFNGKLVVDRKLPPINIFTYILMMFGFRLSTVYFKLSKKTCNHLHFQPGKLG